MSIRPTITFKAGRCEINQSTKPWTVKADPTPGYIYLYLGDEDDLIHFCWRPRSRPVDEPELDLVMIPSDGTFIPYTGRGGSATTENVTSPTDGRIFVLKFNSSSQRHIFWMQSHPQHPDGRPDWFSPRDLRIGQIVDMLLQEGADADVQAELAEVVRNNRPGRDEDHDEDMDDAPPPQRFRSNSTTGGAGADATGGDVREEGEEAREGGADGGRAASGAAPSDASAIIQNFLNSLKSGQPESSLPPQNIFTTLADLLTPDTCVPVIQSASDALVDNLLTHLPPQILLLTQESDNLTDTADPSPETTRAVIAALSREQKNDILIRVIRSPQFHQSLAGLTGALREGGLPTVSEALKVNVANGGRVPGGTMPMGGGDAVEAFLEGVKTTVQEEIEKDEDEGGGNGKMDTS